MQFSAVLFSACAFVSAIVASELPKQVSLIEDRPGAYHDSRSLQLTVQNHVEISLTTTSEVGYVTDGEGKVYQLEITGHQNVRVVTSDRKDGYYIMPISYHVEPAHACNFYSEATRGIGYLIGEFKGPVDADFGKSEWAAFYECWNEDLERASPSGLPVRRGRVFVDVGSD
ncbi:hypothetical protein G6011_09750 [Alternaria panax]|uniref:Uncharacterized protein n=1 Tax=Alternaria panax TaxID=48097 RepID=A0AAD4I5Z3_9PLEO|nr:hypothetical protein G6011_09750 [Alternaria panax]